MLSWVDAGENSKVKHTGPKHLDEKAGYKRLLMMSEKYSAKEIAKLLVDTGFLTSRSL